MKSPEEYVNPYIDVKLATIMYRAIKQAQIDAYNEALEDAAKNSTVEVVDHEEMLVSSLPGYDREGKEAEVILPIYGVDEQSILKLKK